MLMELLVYSIASLLSGVTICGVTYWLCRQVLGEAHADYARLVDVVRRLRGKEEVSKR